VKIKKKILIVGCGKMGSAHLTSFIKAESSYDITVVDTANTIKKLKNKFPGILINYQNKLPKNFFFNLAIIATSSKERFFVSSKIINNNTIKKILLEKFIFQKKNEYLKFDKLLKVKKTKCYVNCWGSTLSKLLKFSKMINKNTTVNVAIKEGAYLTNLIHILSLIFDAINLKKINNYKLIINKIFKSKAKNYDEILGKLSFNTNDNNVYVNISSKLSENTFEIEIKNKKQSVIYLNNKLKLIKKYNNEIEKFNFPLSSVYTEKIYKNMNNKKYSYRFITYKFAKDLSLLIMNLISKTTTKNVSIR
jgi:hypothetical protein